MSKILGYYKNEYENIVHLENNNKKDIYAAYNKNDNRDVTLKIINKEKFKDVNLLKEKLNKEREIMNACNSDNILDIFRILETDKNFILEQEFYETNMHEYINDNGPLDINKVFFKRIVIELAKALKILYEKKIMHRKIKSSSIFLKENKGKYEIKLGNFDQAIYIDDNKSEPLDSFYYTAPEIINGDKYDEKSDLWSFGITLYDLYFGDLPYGYKPSKMKIIKALSSKENFKYEKSNIPLLDKLFEGLLQLNPEDRKPFEKIYEIIYDKGFMNKNVKIKRSILSSSLGGSQVNKNKNYYNILYYNENPHKKYKNIILNDCKSFKKETPGGFIFCTDIESFKLIKEEIKRENKKNNKIIFNLITTGSTFEKINNIIENDKEFANCIENKCIFCIYLEKYKHFIENNPNLNIYTKNCDIKDFIKRNCSNKIIPYKIHELITDQKDNPKYEAIYNFIGKLDEENFKKNFEMFEKFIKKKDQKELKMDKTKFLNVFKNIGDNNFLNIFINNICNDFNNIIIEEENFEECFAYFTGKIIHYLTEYANTNIKYYNGGNKVYMGKNLKLSELLQYKWHKGNIVIPYFSIFYEEKEIAEKLANRKKSKEQFEDNKEFSVIFILRKDEARCGMDIKDLYSNKEKAILFVPFRLFELKKIEFDFNNFTADIFI